MTDHDEEELIDIRVIDPKALFHTAQVVILVLAARNALGWNQAALAEKSGVSKPTLQRLEKLDVSTRMGTIDKLIKALKDAGVEFDISQDKVTVAFPVRVIDEMIRRNT